MDNKDKAFETDIAAIAKKAGVSPKGSSGIAIPESVSGLVFERKFELGILLNGRYS